MANDKQSRRPVIFAAAAASFLMLALGLSYRALAARLGVPTGAAPIAQGAFEQFPLQVGNWTGQEVPLDDAIVRGTSTDAHINRRYSRANGQESILLYIACGIRTCELVYHQPDVCYPASGWTLVEQHSLELPVREGSGLPCTILQFARNELHRERVTVLHYWIVDGRLCRDVSLLRSRLWRLSAKADSIAQVQIVASATETLANDLAIGLVRAFAVDSASAIEQLFQDIEKDRKAQSLRLMKERATAL